MILIQRKLNVSLEFSFRAVVFFNSLGQPRKELVRLRVSSVNVEVTDSDNNPVNSQGGLVFNQFDALDDSFFEVRLLI